MPFCQGISGHRFGSSARFLSSHTLFDPVLPFTLLWPTRIVALSIASSLPVTLSNTPSAALHSFSHLTHLAVTGFIRLVTTYQASRPLSVVVSTTLHRKRRDKPPAERFLLQSIAFPCIQHVCHNPYNFFYNALLLATRTVEAISCPLPLQHEGGGLKIDSYDTRFFLLYTRKDACIE
ncbi:hypothetical protein VTN00DRAFT_595 [Thermoascus crustaceus]|uniref:uncharacterized protein n=1 Tax=Thermoascus crustaceus TaxID=5088 RepID=UPI0037422F15